MKLRIAAVELTIVVHDRVDDSLTESLMAALRHTREAREERATQVKAVIDAITDGRVGTVDMVVFPGWTLVGSDVPSWFREATKRWTTVVEVLPLRGGSKQRGDRPWRTHVLPKDAMGTREGVRAATQRLHETASTAEERAHLRRDVDAGERDWTLGGRPAASGRLLVCGEVNCVGRRDGIVRPLVPLGESLATPRLVVNPAHRPPGSDLRKQQMNAKRKHLAGDGALVTTANRFEFSDRFTGRRWSRIPGGCVMFQSDELVKPGVCHDVAYIGRAGLQHQVSRYDVSL